MLEFAGRVSQRTIVPSALPVSKVWPSRVNMELPGKRFDLFPSAFAAGYGGAQVEDQNPIFEE